MMSNPWIAMTVLCVGVWACRARQASPCAHAQHRHGDPGVAHHVCDLLA